MIQATTSSTTLWQTPSLSAEAREISRRREELLGLLKDLPESEYELSFSDLVEKSEDMPTGNNNEGELQEKEGSKEGKMIVKEKMRRRNSGSSSCSFGSNSGGVLLNVYIPASLTRSLTASRASRVTKAPNVAVEYPESDGEPVTFGCLPGFWERRRGKSRKKVSGRTRSELKSTV